MRELSLNEIEAVNGGDYQGAVKAGVAGAFTGAVAGALRGATIGVFTGPGIIGMVIGGAAMGALVGFTGSALASEYSFSDRDFFS